MEMQLTRLAIRLAEKGLLPDRLIRQGITNLSKQRLQEIVANNCEVGAQIETDFFASMSDAPIANRLQVKQLGYSDEFICMWEFYLCYCEGGFLERALGDVHLLLAKPDNRRTPMS